MMLLILSAMITFLVEVNCDFYTSTDKLQELVQLESQSIEFIGSFIKGMQKLDYLEFFYQSWNNEHNEALENAEKYVTNPLNAFKLIKRNTIDINLIRMQIKTFTSEIEENLKKLENEILKHEEFSGAVTGLLKLQETYNLKSEDLVAGIIEGKQTRKPLSPQDIYEIANESFAQKQNFLAKSYYKILQNNSNTNFHEYTNADIKEKIAFLDNKTLNDPFNETFSYDEIGSGWANHRITKLACRGNFIRSPQVIKNLHCKFVSFSHFSSIGPFKLEEASFEPYIVIYHDMMSDGEVEKLIELARPIRATALVGITGGEFINSDRLAQSAWLYDDHDEVVPRLSKRFEDMTGLNMETAEPLQVQNYGVGGLYRGHYDMNEDRVEEISEVRLATLMLYLSNVEKHGATVFPYIKLRVEPKKGSAIFWYNIKHSGHNDFLTLHSGCPVLLGSKWVANKWIRTAGQEFRRKCKPGKFELKAKEEEIKEAFLAS